MFLYDKFCHSASNERWNKQGALFLYETIDTIQQLTTPGYFNRAILDLNLGDLIITTIITEQETTTYETCFLRVIGLDGDVVVEQVQISGGGGGGTGTVTSVNGVQPVSGNVEITGDNINATVGEEEATITQHLTTLQQSINGKQDALTAEQLAAVNSGITSEKVASYATESWVNQQIQTQIGTIETALAEV